MSEARAGGFVFRGKTQRYLGANCTWSPGWLSVVAGGERRGLRLVCVPFPDVRDVADLPGHAWQSDGDALAPHADTFAEGGLEVGDPEFWILGGRIGYRRSDPKR